MIVQRALAAKSLSHAQGATLMAGFIKVLPLFIMVIPGMMSRVKYPGKKYNAKYKNVQPSPIYVYTEVDKMHTK